MKSRILPENFFVEFCQKMFKLPLYKQIANFEFEIVHEYLNSGLVQNLHGDNLGNGKDLLCPGQGTCRSRNLISI